MRLRCFRSAQGRRSSRTNAVLCSRPARRRNIAWPLPTSASRTRPSTRPPTDRSPPTYAHQFTLFISELLTADMGRSFPFFLPRLCLLFSSRLLSALCLSTVSSPSHCRLSLPALACLIPSLIARSQSSGNLRPKQSIIPQLSKVAAYHNYIWKLSDGSWVKRYGAVIKKYLCFYKDREVGFVFCLKFRRGQG